MLPWKRPEPRDDWETEAGTLLTEVRKDVAKRGGAPHGDDFKKRSPWSGSWRGAGRHKSVLVGAEPWLAKCAWCEQFRASGREIDVEHYRPKVCVTRWDGSPPLVSDAPPSEIEVGPGYWWLAFSWDNYSLACKTCNQAWKRNLFPTAEPRPPCHEGVEHVEKPLLIDPASTFRTRDHFTWTVSGIMGAISPEGRATIVTCGLNRRDLIVLRQKFARDVVEQLDRLHNALRSHAQKEQRRALGRLLELGARSSEFTGMVRWLVEESLGCAWEDLDGAPP